MPRSKAKGNRSQEQVESDFLTVLAELRMIMRKDDLPQTLVQFMLGYAHPQSTGFLKVKKTFKTKGFITMSKGSIQLTPDGIQELPEDMVNPPTTNRDIQERCRELIHKQSAAKKIPKGKFDIIFDKLLDGQIHTKSELLKATGYSHPSSTGFVKSFAALKEFELLETSCGGKQNVQLNNTLFPLGRP